MTLVLKDEYLPVPPAAAIPRRFVVLGAVFACVVGMALGVVLTFYYWHAHHGAARVVARVLPLPVGHVDGHVFWYRQVSERANALELVADVAEVDAVTMAIAREQRNIVLQQLADAMHVRVAREEVDAYIANDTELVLLTSRAGWSQADYREEARLHVLAQKTEQALFASPTHQAYARGRAEKIQAKLDEGISFADLAPHYSEGETAAAGGDLGYVNPETLPVPLADAARTVAVGDRSDILETERSFWLLRVEDRLPADDQGVALVWVRVMEVKKDLLGDIVDRALATANVANWLD